MSGTLHSVTSRHLTFVRLPGTCSRRVRFGDRYVCSGAGRSFQPTYGLVFARPAIGCLPSASEPIRLCFRQPSPATKKLAHRIHQEAEEPKAAQPQKYLAPRCSIPPIGARPENKGEQGTEGVLAVMHAAVRSSIASHASG